MMESLEVASLRRHRLVTTRSSSSSSFHSFTQFRTYLLLLLMLTLAPSSLLLVTSQYLSLFDVQVYASRVGSSPTQPYESIGLFSLSSSEGTLSSYEGQIDVTVTRIYINIEFADTYNSATNWVRVQPTGDYLTSGVTTEIPLTMSSGTNKFYLESPEFYDRISGLFEVDIQRGGWVLQIWSQAATQQLTHCIPGQSYLLRIFPSSSGSTQLSNPAQLQDSDRDYDVVVTSGKLSSSNITFFRSPGAADSWIYFTPDWTSQSDMVLITFTLNFTRVPIQSNTDFDDRNYGDPPGFQIPIVPNSACAGDDGHILLDSQYYLSVQTGEGIQIQNQDITACYWHRPTLFSGENQVWLALGDASDDMQMGVYGGKDTGTYLGSPFIKIPSVNNVSSMYTPYDSSNTMLNLDQWSHVCHVYTRAKAGGGRNGALGRNATLQIYLNGIAANQPTTFSPDWNPLSYGYFPVTIGARADGTSPAYGAFDELNIFSSPLTALQIHVGYTYGSVKWNSQYFSNQQIETRFSEGTGRSIGMSQGGMSWSINGLGDPIWSAAQDPICTAMQPAPGTLNKLSGRDCIQPLSTVSGIGLSEIQDGQLQVGLNDDTSLGGGVWIGLNNSGSDFSRPDKQDSWLVCVWVKRNANYGTNKQQTIWSWGSQNHGGDGLASLSFLGDNIKLSYGKSRTDDSLTPLPASFKAGLYLTTSDDVGLWVHWCVRSIPFNSDFSTLAPTRHILRNGQWFHTDILPTNFQYEIKNVVQVTDNVFTIGGMPFQANPLPLDGTLDELRIYYSDILSFDNIYSNFLSDSWSCEGEGACVVHVPFSDLTKGTDPITGYLDGNPGFGTWTILVGNSSNSLTNGTQLTCIKYGTAVGDDDSQMGDSTQPYVHQYLGLHQYGTTNTDYIATSKELGEALTLATHTYTFKNRDFSFCYWVKRTTASFDTAVTGGISYDLSIGTTIGGTSTMMWSGQMTAASSGTTYYQFAFNSDSLTVPASTVHSNLDTKRWIQVCGTYASKTIHTTAIRKLYRMGILIGQDSPTTDLQSDAPITVGSRADGIFGLSGLHYYDEIRIWTRTITTDDIVSHLNTQAYTGTHPSPVMTFSFTSRSGKGPTATPNNEVLQCSTSCLYKSKTDGGQVTVSLNVPSMCPLGTYADGSLMQTSLAYNPSSSTTSPIAAGTGQYYAETTADELQLSGNVYTVAMWIKRTDISMTSTLLTIGCSTAEHSFRFSSETDIQSPTFGSFTNMQVYLSQPTETLLGSVDRQSGVWPGLGDWSLIFIQFQGSIPLSQNDPIFMIAKDLISTEPQFIRHSGAQYTEWDIDSCKASTGFRVTIGSDTTGTNGFPGYIDDFRLWSRYLTQTEVNSIRLGTSEFVPQYDGIGYHTSQTGMTYGLQLSFNFAEQSGANAYSLHDMTSSTGPQFTRMTQPVNSATEPQWFGSGLTTYLSAGHQNISHPLYPTTMPLAENSITCQKTTLSGRPFMVISSDLNRTSGVLVKGTPAVASIRWTQQLGLQGISVHIVAPTGVTVTPSVITYSKGEGGFDTSYRTLKTFTISATIAQQVTLSFFLTGPEALRYNNPSSSATLSTIPSYQFTAYNDFFDVDVGCFQLHDDPPVKRIPSFSPADGNGYENVLLLFDGPKFDYNNPESVVRAASTSADQTNSCAVRVTRWRNAASMLPVKVWIGTNTTTIASFTMQSSPDQYNLTGFSSTYIWSNYTLMPISDSIRFNVTSPYDGTYQFRLSRYLPLEGYSLDINVPWSATAAVWNNFTISYSSYSQDKFTLTFNSSTNPGLVMVPSSITFLGKQGGTTQVFNMSFTFPATHPATTLIQVDYTCAGYGCDYLTAPASSIQWMNSAGQESEVLTIDIVTPGSTINYTATGLYQYNFTATGQPLFGILNYITNATYTMYLYLDQPLEAISWQMFEDSPPSIRDQPNLAHTIDILYTGSMSIPVARLDFPAPSHAGTHMLYVQPWKGPPKTFFFSLTFVGDLAQVQFVCTSTIDSGMVTKFLNPPGQKTFDIPLVVGQSSFLTNDIGAYDSCALKFLPTSVASGRFDAYAMNIETQTKTAIIGGWIPSSLNNRTFLSPTPLPINLLTTRPAPYQDVRISTPNSGLYEFVIRPNMTSIGEISRFAATLYRVDMDPGTIATTPLTLKTGQYSTSYAFDVNVAETIAVKLSAMNSAANVKYCWVDAAAGYTYGTPNSISPPDSLYNTTTNAATILISSLVELTTYQLWVQVSYTSDLAYQSQYYIEVTTNQNLVKQTWLTKIVFQTNPAGGSTTNPNNPNQGTNSSSNTNSSSSVPASTSPDTGVTLPTTEQNTTSATNGTSSGGTRGRSTLADLTALSNKASSSPSITQTITPTPYQYNYSVTFDSNTTSLSFYVQQANSGATLEFSFDTTTATGTSQQHSLTQNGIVIENVSPGASYILVITSRYSTVTTIYRITISIDAVVFVPCSGDNSCLYGGSCLAADGSPATTTEGSCVCKERFSGPRCQLGVLYCLDNCIIPAAPSNTSAVVYSNISLIVIGADGLSDIQVGDYLIPSSQFTVESLPLSDSRVQLALSQTSKNWDASVTQLQSYSLVTVAVETSKVVTQVVDVPPTMSSSSSSSSTGTDINTLSSSSSTAMDTNGTSSSSSSSSSSSTADSSSSISSSTGSDSSSSSSSTASRRLLSSSSYFLDPHTSLYSPILFDTTDTTTTSNGHHITLTFDSRFDYVSRSVSYTDLAYQSAYATCNTGGPDSWKPDPNDGSKCLPCPVGGTCIGGGIVYPDAGYWSPNEKTPPTSCVLGQDQCPGVNEATLARTQNGSVNTQICGDSYQGVVCTRCEPNHYQSGSQCFPCADAVSEQAQLAGLLILGVAVMSSLSFAVAFASSQALALIVVMFVLLQQAIAVGKDSSASWPSRFKSLSDMFNALGIVNFDLTFMKPGCIAPTYSFISTYYGTLLFALIAFLMFMLSCLIRRQLKFFWNKAQYLLEKREQYKQNDISLKAKEKTQAQVEKENEQWERRQLTRRTLEHQAIRIEFKRRLIHATMILGSLFYLKISTLNVNGLLCTFVPRTTDLDVSDNEASLATYLRVLRNDATIECWVGSHLITSIVISFLLALFTFGFPIGCCIVLTRAFAPIILRNTKSGNTYMKRFFTFLGFTKSSGTVPNQSGGLAVTSATSVVRLASMHRMASLHRAASLEEDYLQRRIDSELRQAEEELGRKLTMQEMKDISEDTKLNEEHSALHLVHMELFGYLFRGLKDERYFFRLIAFPISFSFALVLIFINDLLLRTFMLGLLNCVNAAANSWLIPFIAWQDNMLGCGLPLASVYYTIGVLSLVEGTGSKWYMLILFFIAIAITAQFFFQVITKRPKRVDDLKGKRALEMTRTHTITEKEDTGVELATLDETNKKRKDPIIPKGLHDFRVGSTDNLDDDDDDMDDHDGRFTGMLSVSSPSEQEPIDVPIVRLHMTDASTGMEDGELPGVEDDGVDQLPPMRVQPIIHTNPFPSEHDTSLEERYAAKQTTGRRSRRSTGASHRSNKASRVPSPHRVASPSVGEDQLTSINLAGGYSQPVFKSAPSSSPSAASASTSSPASPSVTANQRALASKPRKARPVQLGNRNSAAAPESARSCLDLCIGTAPRDMKPASNKK